MQNPDIRLFRDPRELAQGAAQHVLEAANAAIERRGPFSIALAGGTTPRLLYQALASDAYRDQTDWRRWEVYFGDERTVPPDHPDSNYRMARDALLSKVPIPPEKIHRIK